MENLKISLSGIRGVVGDTLTHESVFDLGLAFAKSCKGKILIGRDTRPSGEIFSRVLTEAIRRRGKESIDLGILPTPTVLLGVRKMKAGGGIIITASHNPPAWNGLKLVNSQGLFFNSQELKRFLDNLEKVKKGHREKAKPGRLKHSKFYGSQVIDAHINAVLKQINQDLIKKRRFRVGIDPVNGAGVLVVRRFLEKLNCQVYSINENPNGKFGRPPEPLPQNLGGLSKLVKKHHLDLAFAQDPDADRLAVVSERGVPIGEEYTLALAFQGWLRRVKDKPLKNGRAIVINLATSRMVEDVAKEANWEVWRTKVGEANVIEKMKKIGASFGGEGNGGVICPLINWGRDSLVGMGLILEFIVYGDKTISELIGKMPRYHRFNAKIEISSSKIKKIFKVFTEELKPVLKKYKLSFSDGIRVEGKDFWWLVRPSNTEPVIRIMGETKSSQKSKALMESFKKRLIKIEKNI